MPHENGLLHTDERRDAAGNLIVSGGDPKTGPSKTGPVDQVDPPPDPGDGTVPPGAVNDPGTQAGVVETVEGDVPPPILPGDEPPPAPGFDAPVGGALPLLGQGPGIADPRREAAPQTDTGKTEFEAAQRTVGADELVENRLTGLLDSDSKFIRQARQQGLELGGGLGGSSGINAAMNSAIQNALPIAIADAQAFRDAAAQNMDALNQFGLANIQRATQLQLGNLDAATRIQTTHMNNTTQTAIARLQDATSRDIANLDAATRIAVTELNGQIQGRLAELAFKNTTLLNDQQAGNTLEQIALRGEFDLERSAQQLQANAEVNYVNTFLAAYNGALDRLSFIDGVEMDDNARSRAIAAVWEGFDGMNLLIQALYPGVTPIQFEGPPEG